MPGLGHQGLVVSMMGFRRFCVVILALLLGSAAASAAQPATQPNGRQSAALPRAREAAPGQPGAPTAPEMKIAAIVNDEVISAFDLVSRIRMVLVSSSIPDTPENRQRIAAQVLRSLVDEKLELQEAKRQNVTASDDEINKALEQIEKQNNMKSGALNEFMKSRGIDRGALVDQLTASIVWAKLVKRQTVQNTTISDGEIDDALKRVKEHSGEPQSRVAEIFLAVDNPAQDEEVRHVAERLSQQMKQGARFSAVATQFSQSATAAVGGDIGWVRPDQLAADLGKAVSQLKPGELSPPVRTGGGYYLLLVVDRRGGGTGEGETVYDIVQVVFPVPAGNEAARRTGIAEAQSVRAAAKDCPTMLKIGKEKAPQLSSEGKLRSDQIGTEMRNLISKLAIGEPSAPIVQKNGVGVIMVCGKSNGGTTEVSREDAAESLIRQRLDTLARRYMRDLRRNAYVDVRV